MWTCKGDVNSALGESSKEPYSSTISTESLSQIIEYKWDINITYIRITCLIPVEVAMENIVEELHY